MQAESELLLLLETLYASRNPTRRWLHCSRRDWIVEKLRELAPAKAGRALEIGFGAGVYLPVLAELFQEVIATDLDQAHLAHARMIAGRFPNLRLITDDITKTQLPGESFQLALCSEVLEHIPDAAAVFAQIRRLLAPGGTLLVSTPQRHSLLELTCKLAFLPGVIGLVRKIYGEAVFETGHVNLMTERTMTDELERAGFTIRERFKSGMYVPLVAEFMGGFGLRLEQSLERGLRGGPLDWMLWTQYYVAQA
jgi:SAM-dependent methyltransferase